MIMVRRVYTLKDDPAEIKYQIDYQAALNEAQYEVVMAEGGAMLVLAGAGTGKTRTLTYRVARLLESGVIPEQVLLLTFTNKAAKEMLRRVSNLLGERPRGLWGGTFHHVGAKIIRRHAVKLGYTDQFNILDREDSESLMGFSVTDTGIETSGRYFPKPRLLSKLYSLSVNRCQSIEKVVIEHSPRFTDMVADIEKVFLAYHDRKRRLNVMDYDDLLLNWLALFEEHPDLVSEYGNRFCHVLVDEYQDTNYIQGRLIDLCASVHQNLMVVGDDCQSIFGFRGADFKNILQFPDRHPRTKVYKLETNYRSTAQILALANQSISKNTRQFHKILKSVQPDAMKPVVVTCRHAEQQAAFIAQRILEVRDEGVSLNQIAVLYRAHYQSMELQLELGRRQIPFIVRSGVRFFEQAHIKDVLAFLRLVNNPKEQLSMMRIFRTAEGIGHKLGQRIMEQLSRFSSPRGGWSQDGIADELPLRARKSWDQLRKVLLTLLSLQSDGGPSQMVEQVLEGVYVQYLRKTYENSDNRCADIQQLANYANQFKSLDLFLAEVSLQGTISSEEVVDSGEKEEQLVLSSIHQSKGLEFQEVFLVWLSAGRFPVIRADDTESLEEERRLFYVATTRAKRSLYLVHPLMARERERGITLLRISPFIEELSDSLYDEWVINQTP
jgi:DNA helicase-2/ATP-dependent DNA helicase PcrA